MTVSFYTLGCKLNQSESEALASAFQSQGFFISSDVVSSDIAVINSCTVTSKSEQKARRIIRKICRENPKGIVIVTGCYAEVDPASVSLLNENIIVIPQSRKPLLLDVPHMIRGKSPQEVRVFFEQWEGKYTGRDKVEGPGIESKGIEHNKSDDSGIEGRFAYTGDSLQFHSRPFLKIQDGCSRRCAYCRVPYARGDSTSLAADEAVKRIIRLEELGYYETVLTGVNITDYRYRGDDLASLLSLLLSATDRIRVRLSSLEPDQISDRLFALLEEERVCPHFHIPLQSGSSKVLSLMRRPYTADIIYETVSTMRECKEDPFIAADVLVGFPGEDEYDFAKTMEVVESCRFSSLHVFPFSPRPGTAAAAMKPRVPERIIKERTKRLRELARTHYYHYRKRWLNRELNVIIEHPLEQGGEGPWVGISENYLKVAVAGIPSALQKRAQMVKAHISTVDENEELCRGVFLDMTHMRTN
jgi:threonylcarbamoyladenosine tRNA methylthiotransferase MtaB